MGGPPSDPVPGALCPGRAFDRGARAPGAALTCERCRRVLARTSAARPGRAPRAQRHRRRRLVPGAPRAHRATAPSEGPHRRHEGRPKTPGGPDVTPTHETSGAPDIKTSGGPDIRNEQVGTSKKKKVETAPTPRVRASRGADSHPRRPKTEAHSHEVPRLQRVCDRLDEAIGHLPDEADGEPTRHRPTPQYLLEQLADNGVRDVLTADAELDAITDELVKRLAEWHDSPGNSRTPASCSSRCCRRRAA
jgi:hypothetical protein